MGVRQQFGPWLIEESRKDSHCPCADHTCLQCVRRLSLRNSPPPQLAVHGRQAPSGPEGFRYVVPWLLHADLQYGALLCLSLSLSPSLGVPSTRVLTLYAVRDLSHRQCSVNKNVSIYVAFVLGSPLRFTVLWQCRSLVVQL